MASILPGLKTLSLPARRVCLREQDLRLGNDVVVAAAVVDAGNGLARTTLLRQGLVVVKKTADGLYYLATDTANGDRNAPASVSTTTTGDASWNSATVTTTLDGVDGAGLSFVVTLGAGTATAAAAVTDLNNDPVFKAHCVADVFATFVRTRSRRSGSHVHLAQKSSATTWLSGAGLIALGGGTDADYRVLGPGGSTGEVVDMFDSLAVASNTPARNAVAGSFILTQLLGTTPEALAVLCRRGSLLG